MSDTVNIRIKKIIEYFKLNKNSFSVKIGIKPQTLHNIVDGRLTNPSYEVICSIISAFVDINERWLLVGEGEMLKENKTEIKSEGKFMEYMQNQLEQKDKHIQELNNRIIELSGEVSALKKDVEFFEKNNPTKTHIHESSVELENEIKNGKIQ